MVRQRSYSGFIWLLNQRGKVRRSRITAAIFGSTNTQFGSQWSATMNHRFSNQWWNPKFRNVATETVKRCVTCQKNNDVPTATTAATHTPAPPGPYRHLQVDYISLLSCKGKTDVLVVTSSPETLIRQGVLQLHILRKVLSLISFPDGDYQIALTQIKVHTSQDR